MKKRGFTLVELLGVIVILAIIMGIAVVAVMRLNGNVDVTYYNQLEESLLLSGGEYFSYSKDNQPGIFGDQVKVTLKDLVDKKYIDEEIKDKKGNTCDLEKSYVGAYKDQIDKTKYFVCLWCGDEWEPGKEGDSKRANECGGKVDYTLGITAKKKNSHVILDKEGKNWSDEAVELTFETLNEMEYVYVEGTDKKCKLENKNGIKSCTITIEENGIHDLNCYATGSSGGESKETRKENVKLKIDKTGPEFEVKDKKLNVKISGVVNVDVNESNVSAIKEEVEVLVDNIRDNESGIKSIEYSFEKEGVKDKYNSQALASRFEIRKELEAGTYNLKVRVTNNAGIKKEEKIEFRVYREIEDPTASMYCNNLTYNGKTQTLVKSEGEGYVFSKREGTTAGDYVITARLKEGYRFKNSGTVDAKFTCTIKPKDATVTAKEQTIDYGEEIENSLNMVTVTGLLEGDKLTSIALIKNQVGGGKSTIKVSDGIIKDSNEKDVTKNYNIIYQEGKLIVNPVITFKIIGEKPDNVTDDNGYKNGAKVEVTCESIDDISSFVLSGGSEGNGTLTGGTKKTGTLTLNDNGKNKEVKGVCKTTTGGEAEATEQYNIYVYNANESACGCQERNSCKNESACGCSEYYSCASSSACGTKSCNCSNVCVRYKCVGSNGGTIYECTTGAGKCGTCASGSFSCASREQQCGTCAKSCRHKGCGCETAKSCVNDSCSCKTAKSCWHL